MNVCSVYMNSKIPRPEGKRETGGSPVRTRHRDKLMPRHYVTGETREDAVDGACSNKLQAYALSRETCLCRSALDHE